MDWRNWLYLILFTALLSLPGCFGPDLTASDAATATSTATAVPIAAEPIPLSLAKLAANPEAYRNQPLRLTGRYTPQPRLVCAGETYRSPATWGLADGEVLAYAGGLNQLRRLLPRDLEMTVEGVWRRWEGPVGCGKAATKREIWYLAVHEIISPSPISRVTLTPTAVSTDLIAQITPGGASPTATMMPGVTAVPTPATPPNGGSMTTPSATPDAARNTATPTVTATTAVSPTMTITRSATLTSTTTPAGPTPTPDATRGTATPSPTPTNDDVETTATPTGTPDPNVTPTATGTPLPSATPDDATIVEMGLFEDQFLAVEQVEEGEVDSWILDVAANATLSVTVGAVTANSRLLLLDRNGAVLATQDETGSGAMETLVYTSGAAAQYELRVRMADDAAAEYVMMLLYDSSYPFLLQDFIPYGGSETVDLAAGTDHFWHFAGSSGDEISIFVVPDSNADAFMQLYGVEASTISSFIDLGGAGEAESLEAFTLPADGIYSIRVGEFDYQAAQYQISIVKNN